MKKDTIITTIVVVAVVGLIGGFWLDYNYGNTYYYGQVSGHVERTEKAPAGYPKRYYYIVNGWDKDGNHKRMEVGSINGHRFVKNRFIRIGWSRVKKVNQYEQITYNQIPKAARDKIMNSK